MKKGFLFSPVPRGEEEFLEVLDRGTGLRVERIVSQGHVSPEGFWYDQDEGEWVAVLQGKAELEFVDESRIVSMEPGDWVSIAPHERHRVRSTSDSPPCVWLAVFGVGGDER